MMNMDIRDVCHMTLVLDSEYFNRDPTYINMYWTLCTESSQNWMSYYHSVIIMQDVHSTG